MTLFTEGVLIITGLAAAIALVLVLSLRRLVPAKHVVHVRNPYTQSRRALQPGFNLTWPWEEYIAPKLPIGEDDACPMDKINPAAILRYDPEPYSVMTKDAVNAEIDLFVEYAIMNMDTILDTPDADYGMIIDDAARQMTVRLASQFKAADLTAVSLGDQFEKTTWPSAYGLQIKRVGVQHVTFDPAMQEMLRAVALGATPEQVLEHSSRRGLSDALRANKNASVFLGTPTPTVTATRVQPRRAARQRSDDEVDSS
jgi:regulator of protease activity HflC (stomatin/prohibitin superfamily)